MRLLNLRINFFIYCRLFVLILVVFCVVSPSLRFGQISPLAFFRWLTATSKRNAESCNVFEQVNLWPAWVGIETAIFWQCSPGTVETQRVNPWRDPWRSGYRRWVSTVPGEHCQKIAVSIPTQAGQRFTCSKTWCDRQQLWKVVITGDTVTRLSIPIQGRG